MYALNKTQVSHLGPLGPLFKQIFLKTGKAINKMLPVSTTNAFTGKLENHFHFRLKKVSYLGSVYKP